MPYLTSAQDIAVTNESNKPPFAPVIKVIGEALPKTNEAHMQRTYRNTTLIVFLLASLCGYALAQTTDKRADAELRDLIEKARVAALRSDKKFFEQYLADGYIETNQDGKTFTKKEILDGWQPPPADFKPSSEISELKLVIHENTAVASYRLNWQNNMGSQTIKLTMRATDVFKRNQGRWQLLADHASSIPKSHPVAQVSLTILDDYVGQYQNAAGISAAITREANKLVEQFVGTSAKTDLYPENETTFWPKEDNNARVFVRDAQGRVTHVIVRLSDGQEFQAKKIK